MLLTLITDAEFSDNPILEPRDIVAEVFATPDLLDSGHWTAIEGEFNLELLENSALQHARDRDFIGTTIEGSAIVMKFLSACQGKLDWDMMYDPDYFEKFLLEEKRSDPRITRVFGKPNDNTLH